MLPYWLLFFVPAWMALTRLRPAITLSGHCSGGWRVMFALLTLMIGLRYDIGGDWETYLPKVINASYQTLAEAVAANDPAYGLLNWLGAKSGFGIYLVNTVCAAIFSWGLVVFCRAQPRPWLALVIAIPYLVTVVGMGYTRQGTAIGFAMLGLVALSNRQILHFVVFIVLAATFHKTAVILMPLAVLAGTKRKLWTAFWVGLSSFLFYGLLLQESVEALQYGYLEKEYQSQGAALRLAMNALPALLFLWFRRRFVMPQAERTFWTWMSLGALAFLGLLVVSPSSTAVDRVALYWIPIQLYVLSRLPNALGSPNGRNGVLVRGVVAYSAVVLFVWLVFASHSKYWLPYQFYPWVAIWN
jgi:hypothetical protein